MPSGEPLTTATAPPGRPTAPARSLFCGLLQRRLCVVPTWRGWLALFLVATCLILFAGRNLYAFLAVSDSVPGGVLVVEGWVPTSAVRAAVAEFHSHPYLGIYVTGLPIEEGNPYIGYKNYADFTAERLVKMGAPAASVHVAPAPTVEKDRTYNMATVLRNRLEADHVSTTKINVVTRGPHSRRSRLLYEEAFGPHSQIGMLSVADEEFDPDHWWKTSAGVRDVIGESIAYLYARLLFRPADN